MMVAARATRLAAHTLWLGALGLVSFGMAGCQGSVANHGNSPPPASATAAGTSSAALESPGASTNRALGAASGGPAGVAVASALSAPIGTELVVSGLYLGWEGPCVGAPPTKSAWQLADDQAAGAACIYVDGPLLSGLSRKAMLGNPVRVRVTGVVREDGKARYLESHKVDPQ